MSCLILILWETVLLIADSLKTAYFIKFKTCFAYLLTLYYILRVSKHWSKPVLNLQLVHTGQKIISGYLKFLPKKSLESKTFHLESKPKAFEKQEKWKIVLRCSYFNLHFNFSSDYGL